MEFNAFSDCDNLVNVEVLGKNSSFQNNTVFQNSPQVVISCWKSSAAHNYAVANNIDFKLFDASNPMPVVNWEFVLPAGIVSIEEDAFSNIAASSIKLSECVESISAKAFSDCPNLTHVYIPENCEDIGSNAFENVTALTIHGDTGSYAEAYASDKEYGFIASAPLSERIREYIMDDSPNQVYDPKLDLNEDGVINSVDYVIARNIEMK